jgi:2-polyprenyl-6-hydroxyphenyl methylase/3-demethylubiquinone-9 3-methyltransferase
METRDIEMDREVKEATRAVWAAGDYHRFASEVVWDLGRVLVDSCPALSGRRVLDVACGSGNAALRAAARGAEVVGCDLTPENFAAGADQARASGVEVEWVVGDAESLPFPDASFDVVMSSVGAMWAPDHRRVAHELTRVARPGGLVAMVNFAADGLLGPFLDVFAPYAPPPPPWASSPLLWGDPDHLADLFGNRVDSLEVSEGRYVESLPGGPRGYCDFYKETFGPVVTLYAALADQPARRDALDRDFLAFATQANRGPVGGRAELTFGYVVVVATVAGGRKS